MSESITTILYLLIPIFLLAYYYWSRRHLYLAAAKIKGPWGLPFIGSGHIFMGKSEEMFGRINGLLRQVNNEPMKVWLGPFLMIILKNPEYLEKIMSSQRFSYKHELYVILESAMGKGGLISASGLDPKVKSYRKKIQPLFDLNFINTALTVVHKNFSRCIKVLDGYVGGEEFDVDKIFFRCTTDMMAEIILGKELNVQETGTHVVMEAFIGVYDILFLRFVKIWMFPDILFNLWHDKRKRFQKSLSVIRNFIEESLIDSWKRRKIFTDGDNINKYVPIIDKLTEIVEQNPKWMSHCDLVDNLITLYTAAEDTIGTILSFAVICFGMYPEYQEKAAYEIKCALGEKCKQLTLADIYKLEYLDMCVKDILRLFPIAPFIIKRVTEEYQIDKWTIPRGAALFISIYSLHMDPQYWENPEHFYPEHFSQDAIRERHCYAYLPFSAGPRGCIGKTMANVLLKYIIATFLQHYKVEAKGKVPDLKLRSDISVRSTKGYKCRIAKRIWQ